MNKKTPYSIIFFILFFSVSLFSVENSIIPQVEHFERVESLNPSKYSRNQFAEITNALALIDERIRIVSFNVLFPLYDHKLPPIHRWPQRLNRVVAIIQDMQPDVMGVQELYPNQLEDLQKKLGDEWDFFSESDEDGELNGIFYRRSRFDVMESKAIVMRSAGHPDFTETLTMLQLKDNITGRVLAVFNAHLAFSKIDKRDFQTRFIAEYIKPIAEEMPVVFMGDLNTFTQRLDLPKLPFYDGDYLHRILTAGPLREAKERSLLGHLGPISTFTNAAEDVQPFTGKGTPGIFLDHIYVSPRVTVLIHAVQSGTIGGEFPSDHMPILADIIID